MGLIHTDTPVSNLKINKFASVADFEAAQAQSLIGADEISFIDEAMQVDWNQSDNTKPDYIKNKPTIPNIPSQTSQSGKFLTTDGTNMSWANTPTELPSITGNASKILSVNSGATGVEWITNSGGGGGLTNYDFTHVANTTVSSPFTFTCAANQRNSQKITTGANLTLNITCNNGSDNYLWIVNSSSVNDIDVVLGTVTYNGTTLTNSSITVPPDGITVPKSGFCEISIIMNADGCVITTRNDLVQNS